MSPRRSYVQIFRPDLIAVGAIAISIAVRALIQPVLGGTQVWLTFWPAVFVASWYGGRRAGLEAVALSLVMVFLWLTPKSYLTTASVVIGGTVFALCGLGFARLTEMTRRAQGDERGQRETILAYAAALARARSPRDVARVLVDHGAAAVGADDAVFARCVDDDELEVLAHHGAAPAPSTLPRTGPLGRAIDERAEQGCESDGTIALPLEVDGRVVGAVALRFAPERRLPEHRRDRLRTLVAHAAQAFERAELFEHEQHANRRRRAMIELATVLAAAQSTDDVAQAVITEGVRGSGADTAVLYVVDDETRQLEVVAQHGEAQRDLPVDSAHARELQTERWIEDPARWSVPLVAAGKVIGVLAMGFHEPRRFDPAEREFVRLFAHHCAQALARADRAAASDAACRAKDDFLAMLGHELRNPLAPMTTALELIAMRGGLAPAQQRPLGVLKRQVQHLTRMVDDLLDVSRIQAGKVQIARKTTELGDILCRAIEMVSPLLEERRHTLVYDTPAPGQRVDVDATRMAQVFANILFNAAKYTDPGGKIEVVPRDVGGEIVVDISDNGGGIDPPLLRQIFDQFTQAPQSYERSRGGLGLGLAIARMIVDLHGGTLTAHSDGRGRGSRFTVTLPRANERQALAPANDVGVVAPGTPAKRVLVVDDNTDAAEMLAELAEHRGHAARRAGDGPDALRILEHFTPDVALLDLGLPVMDGYELAQKIREIPGLEGIRLVAVTGYGQPSDLARARAAGFDLHLVKPVQIADVVRAIEEPRVA